MFSGSNSYGWVRDEMAKLEVGQSFKTATIVPVPEKAMLAAAKSLPLRKLTIVTDDLLQHTVTRVKEYPKLPFSKLRLDEWFELTTSEVTREYLRSQIRIIKRNPLFAGTDYSITQGGKFFAVRRIK